MPRDREALGAFLRSRRDRLTPAQAGVQAFPGPRRVPGLRREELSLLAGVSPDYYSRLEQGRQANVSLEVLDALSRALRLDAVESAHLRDLAAPAPRRRSVPDRGQRPDPGLLRLVANLDHRPVLLLGRRGEVLARNALLRSVLGRPMEPGSSLVRYLFFDPTARERIVNWADFAATTVASLRREAARRPHDATLRALIDELRAGDEDAARWWDDQTVRDYTSVAKQIQHPTAGPLSFDIEIVVPPHDPDQHLIVYTTPTDSPTARVLGLLASWDADVPVPLRHGGPPETRK